jgi:hypothetical protein
VSLDMDDLAMTEQSRKPLPAAAGSIHTSNG